MFEPHLEGMPLAALKRLQEQRLRKQRRVLRRFKIYRPVLRNCQIGGRVPSSAITDGDIYQQLGPQAVALCDSIYYIENTSGTTGSPKSRIVTSFDDDVDVRLFAR